MSLTHSKSFETLYKAFPASPEGFKGPSKCLCGSPDLLDLQACKPASLQACKPLSEKDGKTHLLGHFPLRDRCANETKKEKK